MPAQRLTHGDSAPELRQTLKHLQQLELRDSLADDEWEEAPELIRTDQPSVVLNGDPKNLISPPQSPKAKSQSTESSQKTLGKEPRRSRIPISPPKSPVADSKKKEFNIKRLSEHCISVLRPDLNKKVVDNDEGTDSWPALREMGDVIPRPRAPTPSRLHRHSKNTPKDGGEKKDAQSHKVHLGFFNPLQ